jgi:two-component system, chemotaxis family, sensor kinase CheA
VIVEAAGERYAIPTHSTAAVVDDSRDAEVGLEGRPALWVGSGVVPLASLSRVVGAPGPDAVPDGPVVVIAPRARERCALRVDAVTGQRDVTVKQLGGVLPRSTLVAGAGIDPDGSVTLVLDPAALAERSSGRQPARALEAPDLIPAPAETARATVLVVDDAVTVRELQRAMLQRAGYEVRTASDGDEALTLIAQQRPDLLITDVEMPNMDGLTLTRAVRATPALASLPVLVVTSRSADEDRRQGLEAGADAYLGKQDFDEAALLDAVARLLGSAH